VNPIVPPTFSFGSSQSVCINSTPPVLPTISTNGITGVWSPATVDNQNSGTYTFTPLTGQCATSATFTYQVNPIPSVINIRNDTTVNDGAVLPPYNFPVNIPVTGINWMNSNPSIGLASTGSGTVPSFTATNMTDGDITAVITATPYVNGCSGITQYYKITVRPLNKDIFVPNVFSPNNDGKNDGLFVYGNYISSFELRIFNQWGQQMVTLTDKKQGWDGKFRGSAQPVGVYVYVLKAVMTDGRQVVKKGSITLVR
jgi:gliding motility-associated-like protein